MREKRPIVSHTTLSLSLSLFLASVCLFVVWKSELWRGQPIKWEVGGATWCLRWFGRWCMLCMAGSFLPAALEAASSRAAVACVTRGFLVVAGASEKLKRRHRRL